MYCLNCGNKIDDSAKFCGKCGKAVNGGIDSQKKSGNESPHDATSVDNNNYLSKIIHAKSRRRLYFGYLLLAIAAIIFIYQHNYISNLISGPRSISETSLESELVSGNIKDINLSLIHI